MRLGLPSSLLPRTSFPDAAVEHPHPRFPHHTTPSTGCLDIPGCPPGKHTRTCPVDREGAACARHHKHCSAHTWDVEVTPITGEICNIIVSHTSHITTVKEEIIQNNLASSIIILLEVQTATLTSRQHIMEKS